MPEKVSKAAVNYREATGDQRCRNCSMFRRGKPGEASSCTLVLGSIHPADTCDEFERG